MNEESNLVAHAKRELKLLGEDEYFVNEYLKMIQIFADMGHSGFSAAHFTATLNALLQYQNLTPLTDDEDEWMYHGPDLWNGTEGIWQNKRSPAAFSSDGGKTYSFVNDDEHKPQVSVHKE